MDKLLNAEIYKLRKSKKNCLIFILFFLFLIGIIIYISYMNINFIKFSIRDMQEEKKYADDNISVLNIMIERNDNITTDIEDKKKFWEKESLLSLQLEYFFKEYDNSEWERYLSFLNEKYENLLSGYEKGYVHEELLASRGQSPEELRENLLLNQYYLKNSIVPEINPYYLSGCNFLLILLRNYIPVIFIVLSVLFIGDLFHFELEEGSYKISYTQPYKRKVLFRTRIYASQVLQIGLLILTILFFYFILSIKNGSGDIMTPAVLRSGKPPYFFSNVRIGDIYVTASYKVILAGYLLLIIMIFMFSMVSIYITFLLRSSTNAISIIIGLIVISIVFLSFVNKYSILQYINPLTYINISSVLMSRVFTGYIYGLTINSLLGLLFLKKSLRKFCKMDMLEGGY